MGKKKSILDAHGNYIDGWEKIGFHRAVGGFFFNYVPALVLSLLYLFVAGVIIPSILPFPDAKGYYAIATNMYSLLFLLFDMGTQNSIGRFVPEYRIKDPQKACQYVSFFIWYQMCTGLIQVTGIAFYVFLWIPPSQAHLMWIFLIYSTIQYPGMLSILTSVLKSFQHYSKYLVVRMFEDVVDFSGQIAFIILGRLWGASNPAIGELMGMSIGLVIGLYVHYFFAFVISAKLFDKILRGIGLNIGICLRPTFTREIAKESLSFGVKTMPGAIYGTVLGFLSFLVTFNLLPQYATWMGLISLTTNFTNLIDTPGTIRDNCNYSVTEAYNNNKKNLSHYYIAQSLKWRYFLTLYLGITIVVMVPIALGSLLKVFGENWLPAMALMPVLSIPQFLLMFEKPVSFTQLNHPGYDQWIAIAQSTVAFLWYMFLIYGINVNLTITLFILKDIPITLIFYIIGWILLDKKVLNIHLRDFIVQVFLLPIPPMIIYAFFAFAYGLYLFPIGAYFIGEIPFAFVTIVMVLFVWPYLIVCPLMGFFGAWDDYGIQTFKESTELSGPSKFMMKLMFKTTLFFYKRSPWKGKYPILGSEIAVQEALELENFKKTQDMKNVI
nr:hypothetical protein [Candidatus Sigynarchaeota archaeon]